MAINKKYTYETLSVGNMNALYSMANSKDFFIHIPLENHFSPNFGINLLYAKDNQEIGIFGRGIKSDFELIFDLITTNEIRIRNHDDSIDVYKLVEGLTPNTFLCKEKQRFIEQTFDVMDIYYKYYPRQGYYYLYKTPLQKKRVFPKEIMTMGGQKNYCKYSRFGELIGFENMYQKIYFERTDGLITCIKWAEIKDEKEESMYETHLTYIENQLSQIQYLIKGKYRGADAISFENNKITLANYDEKYSATFIFSGGKLEIKNGYMHNKDLDYKKTINYYSKNHTRSCDILGNIVDYYFTEEENLILEKTKNSIRLPGSGQISISEEVIEKFSLFKRNQFENIISYQIENAKNLTLKTLEDAFFGKEIKVVSFEAASVNECAIKQVLNIEGEKNDIVSFMAFNKRGSSETKANAKIILSLKKQGSLIQTISNDYQDVSEGWDFKISEIKAEETFDQIEIKFLSGPESVQLIYGAQLFKGKIKFLSEETDEEIFLPKFRALMGLSPMYGRAFYNDLLTEEFYGNGLIRTLRYGENNKLVYTKISEAALDAERYFETETEYFTNLTRETDEMGNKTEYHYDKELLKEVIYPEKQKVSLTYDNNENVEKMALSKDYLQEEIRYGYNDDNLQKVRTDGSEFFYEYDDFQRPVRVSVNDLELRRITYEEDNVKALHYGNDFIEYVENEGNINYKVNDEDRFIMSHAVGKINCQNKKNQAFNKEWNYDYSGTLKKYQCGEAFEIEYNYTEDSQAKRILCDGKLREETIQIKQKDISLEVGKAFMDLFVTREGYDYYAQYINFNDETLYKGINDYISEKQGAKLIYNKEKEYYFFLDRLQYKFNNPEHLFKNATVGFWFKAPRLVKNGAVLMVVGSKSENYLELRYVKDANYSGWEVNMVYRNLAEERAIAKIRIGEGSSDTWTFIAFSFKTEGRKVMLDVYCNGTELETIEVEGDFYLLDDVHFNYDSIDNLTYANAEISGIFVSPNKNLGSSAEEGSKKIKQFMRRTHCFFYKGKLPAGSTETNLKCLFDNKAFEIIKENNLFSMLQKTIIKIDHKNVIEQEYVYYNVFEDDDKIKKSFLVKEENIYYSNKKLSIGYTYDISKNIKKITNQSFGNTSYEYDYRGYLIRETGHYDIAYTYNTNGNIASKTVNGKTYNYVYDTKWPDRLISFNGKEIKYNNNSPGNPLSYGNVKYNFECSNLIEYKDDSQTINYFYDEKNQRIIKKTNNNMVKYYYEGNKLLTEIRNKGTELVRIDYYYDQVNQVIGFNYQGNNYFYLRDITLRVLGIVDESGNLLARYNYEAFGKHEVLNPDGTVNNEANFIGNVNPIRYKGYYYDVETGLFLLTSRFYDPEIGRFISPDDIKYLAPNQIGGLNLFSYCFNNPINYADPSGNFPFLITMAIIGLVVGGGIGAGIGVSKGHTGWQLVGDIALGAGIGAVAGALIGATISGALTGSFFSSWTGVKAGAKLVYGMYKAAGAGAAGYMMLDNLGNSFSQFTHVFWSGGYRDDAGNIVDVSKIRAVDLANSLGGKTLEMTRLGMHLERIGASSQAWSIASLNFASQVPYMGQAYSILYYPGMSEAGVWFTTELPELTRRLVEILIGGL